MSYYSEVRIATTREGFNSLRQEVNKKADDRKEKNELFNLDKGFDCFHELYGCGDCISFGWNGVKWYEETIPDVKDIMEALYHLNDKDIPFHYISVGEDNAVEELSNREDELSIGLSAVCTIEIEQR